MILLLFHLEKEETNVEEINRCYVFFSPGLAPSQSVKFWDQSEYIYIYIIPCVGGVLAGVPPAGYRNREVE